MQTRRLPHDLKACAMFAACAIWHRGPSLWQSINELLGTSGAGGGERGSFVGAVWQEECHYLLRIGHRPEAAVFENKPPSSGCIRRCLLATPLAFQTKYWPGPWQD